MEFDDLLHYGLVLGAVFQLIALGAIIFLPDSNQEEREDVNKEQEKTSSGSVTSEQAVKSTTPRSTPTTTQGPRKRGKKQKK